MVCKLLVGDDRELMVMGQQHTTIKRTQKYIPRMFVPLVEGHSLRVSATLFDQMIELN